MLNQPNDFHRHPCFDSEARGQHARIHLPVAPKCNIQCNYCNRRYDCANESRPGVTSAVLAPHQALHYLQQVMQKEPRISVVGIAGPGDPFANADETMQTLQLVRDQYPTMLLCVATNGLGLPAYAQQLAELRVSHVTITCNAVDPEIGAKVYGWVRDNKQVLRGVPAAQRLIARQLDSVAQLKEFGITVKVNTIIVPGVNDAHIPDVARKMASLGADVMNCIPLYPTAGTAFQHFTEPTHAMTAAIRAQAEAILPQMQHCTRCRADAVGLLGESRTEEFADLLTACSRNPVTSAKQRGYVAVASQEGALVNLHLGEADELLIYRTDGHNMELVDRRPTPPKGGGIERWTALAQMVDDCHTVLVSGAGDNPRRILTQAGIAVHEVYGFIEDALEAVASGGDLRAMQKRRGGGCKKLNIEIRPFAGCGVNCGGDGMGCD